MTELEEYLRRAALALREEGRVDETEALLREAIDRFPDAPQPLLEWAALAHNRRDWTTAAARWEQLRTRFPGLSVGYSSGGAALREAGQAAEAAVLLADAVARFPGEPRPAIEQAWTTYCRGDLEAALGFWETVRTRFPDQIAGHIGMAKALCAAGRLDAADELLVAMLAILPDEPTLRIEYAAVALHRRDWPQAETRWHTVLSRFPDNPAGYVGLGMALRAQGRWGDAEALLSGAVARFPSDSQLRIEQAWVSQAARNWPVAAERWERVRNILPDSPIGYAAGTAALREAGRLFEAADLAEAAMTRFPDYVSVAVEHALLAHHLSNRGEAVHRWERVRDHFPDQACGYAGLAAALREAGRTDKAEALIAAGLDKFADDLGLRAEHAAVAAERGDWPEAERRWKWVLTHFPERPVGYTQAALALREQRRLAEAEALLAEAVARFPNDLAARSDYAGLAQRAGDWPEAVRRWQAIRTDFPNQPAGYIAGAAALRDAGRLPQAEQLLTEAVRRFPEDREAAIELARAAELGGDQDAALRCWATVRDRFPDEAPGYCGAARLLRRAGHVAEAEGLLAEAMRRLPGNPEPAIEYARIAQEMNDLPEATRRWELVRSRFPDRPRRRMRDKRLPSDRRHR